MEKREELWDIRAVRRPGTQKLIGHMMAIKKLYEDEVNSIGDICEKYEISRSDLKIMMVGCEWVKGVRTRGTYYKKVKKDRRKVWRYVSIPCGHYFRCSEEEKLDVCPCGEVGDIYDLDMEFSKKLY